MTETSSPRRPEADAFITLWLLLAAALLLLGSFIVWDLNAERSAVDAGERARLAHQAQVIDKNISEQLMATHRAMHAILAELPFLKAQKDSQLKVNQRLKTMEADLTGVRTIVILDAEGTVTAGNRAELVGRNFSEREYVQIARQSGNPDVLHLSPPYKTSLGVFAMNLTQVMVDDQGRFAGLIVATLDPTYFNTLLESVNYAPDMWASVAHADGKLFIMVPERSGVEGLNLDQPGSMRNRHRDSGQMATVMTGIIYATGEERMMAQRTIKPDSLNLDKALAVAVARDLRLIFAPWRQNAYWVAGLYVVLVLGSCLGMALYQRDQRQFDRITAIHEAEQKRQIDQYRNIVQASLDGFRVTDFSGRILEANESICRMLGYSREELLGLSIANIESNQSPENIGERIGEIIETGHAQLEARHRCKDGTLIDVEVSVQYIAAMGEKLFAFVRDITARKRAEETILELNRNFIAFLENTTDFIYFKDHDSRFRFCSQTLADITGHASWRDMIGKHDLEVFPQDTAQIYHEEELPIFRDGVPLLNKVDPYYDAAGNTGWVSTNKWPVKDDDGKVVGLFGISRDISEYTRAQETLRQSEARYRAVAQSANDAIVTADSRGMIINWSRGAESMFGYTVAEAMAMPLTALMPQSYRERHLSGFGRVMSGGEARTAGTVVKLAALRKDGTEFPIEASLSHWDVPDGRFVTGIIRDITEREAAIADLKRSNDELEQFSYAISHDMRQPLRMISSYMQLLEKGLTDQLDAEKQEFFDFAIDGAKRLDAMLVGLLEYSRVGQKCSPPALIESRDALDQALLFLEPALVEAQAELRIEGDWPRVFASPDEILRLLQNLIGNALKFRVEGRKPEITVTGRVSTGSAGRMPALPGAPRSEQWCVSIADNGVGINAGQIDRLFQVFQRLQLRTDYEGTGIGLALCRKIVEHHGGRIWAESAGEGQGSTFSFSIPATSPPPEPA